MNNGAVNGEMIMMRLYNVGRHIDLSSVLGQLAGTRVAAPLTRDSPENISLPKPVVIDVDSASGAPSPSFKSATLRAKVYEEGVVAFIARLAFEGVPPEKLHELKNLEFKAGDGTTVVGSWIERHYQEILPRLEPFVDKEYYKFVSIESEAYAAYCITDELGDPFGFVQGRANYFAAFLQGDNPALRYHPRQIRSTLDNQFSYMENDLAIFDMDRCLIFDPSRDYEDILLVAELANSQVLQLSALDKVLDHELDVAEDDLRRIFSRRRKPFRALGRKAAELKKLRVDMVFLLENIENTSKIIGDFFLAQIHAHLSSLFKLADWSTSIRNRLEALEDIYNTARSDISDSLFLYMEIFLTAIFAMEFVLFLAGLGG
ncbi:MAG: hypothetical protein JW839_22200 [Candidatus Lokiarchaeota archaeon]|nr:hypothetical protein [Candidatus Lokiarchaeota archaeon]